MGMLTPPRFTDAAGQEYSLVVHVSPQGMEDTLLDIAAIEQFDYQTQMNDLVARGSIVYTDSNGQLDRLLCRPYGTVSVQFQRYSTEVDGEINAAFEDPGDGLTSDFLIESVGILERRREVVKYRISFTSVSVVNCLGVVDFSNYGKAPEPVLDIIRQIAVGKAGLAVDDESFGRAGRQPSMNYITNGNDNLFTASKFLLDKLYYGFPRSRSMAFVFWDELDKKLRLFDMANADTATGRTPIVIGMYDSMAESATGGVSNEFGTVTKFPTSVTTKAQYRKQIASYDYSRNRFDYDNISQAQQRLYMNARFQQLQDVSDKYLDIVKPGQFSPQFTERGSFWNNDFHFYGTFVDTLLNSNALMVKSAGVIDRRPGCVVDMFVNKGDAQQFDEDPQMYDEMMKRFRGLEGMWIATRVHNYVRPNDGRENAFRQVLTLVRNFVVDKLG